MLNLPAGASCYVWHVVITLYSYSSTPLTRRLPARGSTCALACDDLGTNGGERETTDSLQKSDYVGVVEVRTDADGQTGKRELPPTCRSD